ncbi:sensor histidine kinase [Paenibacillus cremeus]|uniref:histidine kinase n=1 Tax=Paenibacillus cremeus TaxID=2163881 RepID=A0A559KGM3_9BACL|nr:sensor histidine kinase [Paenibacillus cremeus]TVY11277.1 sensor histidine kinase [Paenibacillus cremeus]
MKRARSWRPMKNVGLQSKIFAYYALLIVIIFLSSSIVLYYYISNFTKNVVGDYALNTIQQTNMKLDSWMQELESLSKTIMWNGNVRDLLVDYSGSPSDFIKKMQVSGYFSLLTAQRDDIQSILLLKNSDYILKYGNFYDSEPEERRWRELMSKPDSSYQAGNFILSGSIKRVPGDVDMTFAGMRQIYDKFTFTSIGAMVIEFKYSRLSQFMSILDSKRKEHYLVNGEGMVLYSTHAEDVGNKLNAEYMKEIAAGQAYNLAKIEGNKMIAYNRSAYTGWYIISVTPLSEIVGPLQWMQRIFLAVSVIGITVALALSAWLSRSITSPLTELVRKMRLISLSNLKQPLGAEPVQIQSYNEIERLNHTFNTMLREIDHMISEVYEARLKQTETELKVLRAQINPHFLYNTLDVIHWRLIVDHQNEVASLVRALCGMLRYNINDSDKPVQIRDEIAQIRNFMAIQQARFGNTIHLQIQVQPEIEQLSICKFILQPIVENCLIHGFKARSQGKIVINGYLEEGQVRLEVVDDGIGMTPESLNVLNSTLAARSNGSTGIGIHNVNQRIQLCYGSQYGLSFESLSGEGTKVRITLPQCG